MKTLTLITFLLISSGFFSQDQTSEQQIEYDRTFKKYFVVEFIPVENHGVSEEKQKVVMQNHMVNIRELVGESKLVLAGPFETGGGLFFMNVPDMETAENIISEDPTVREGLNTFKIRAWFTEKGLFTLENSK